MSRHIDLIASAIAHRLNTRVASARTRVASARPPIAANLASAVARRITATRVASAIAAARLASATAGRLSARPVASVTASRLASAVAQSLAKRRTGASARPSQLRSSHTQIASSIARRVLSRAPEARLSAVDFGSVDALKVASAVARRLEVLREKPVDATALVASAIARHLATPKLQGSSQAAQRLHARVASAVGYALQVKKTGGKDEQPAKAPAAGNPKLPTPGKA